MRFRTSILFLLFLPCIISAQEQDFECWTGFSLKKKMSNRFRLLNTNELRLNENSTKLESFYFDFGGEYRFNEILEAGLFYRIVQKFYYDDYSVTQHRFYFDISFTQNLKRLRLQLRNRVQTRYSAYLTTTDGVIPQNHNRTRLSAKYNLAKSPVSPEISLEFYYNFSRMEIHAFDKYRLTIGFDYKLTKKSDMTFFVRREQELNENNPLLSHIIGISWAHDL
ncbi:MAG: DUF2490 domain-containing protein [Bacteroidota bacterium]